MSQEYRVTQNNVEMPLREYIAMVVASEVGPVRQDVRALIERFDRIESNRQPVSPDAKVSKNTSFRLQVKGALQVIVHLVTWALAGATLWTKIFHP